jgi:hypothetical protein
VECGLDDLPTCSRALQEQAVSPPSFHPHAPLISTRLRSSHIALAQGPHFLISRWHTSCTHSQYQTIVCSTADSHPLCKLRHADSAPKSFATTATAMSAMLRRLDAPAGTPTTKRPRQRSRGSVPALRKKRGWLALPMEALQRWRQQRRFTAGIRMGICMDDERDGNLSRIKHRKCGRRILIRAA